MNGRGDSLCFSMRGEMKRAMISAPPPVPAGTTNSTGFVGPQAAAIPWPRPDIATIVPMARAKRHPPDSFRLLIAILLVVPNGNDPPQPRAHLSAQNAG